MKDRKNIKERDKWNLKPMFKDKNEFDKELKALTKLVDKLKLFEKKNLNLKNNFVALLIDLENFDRRLEKIAVFSRLKRDEDLSDKEGEYYFKSVNNFFQINMPKISFINPKLLKVSKSKALSFIKGNEKLKHYKHEIDCLYRYKDNTLIENEEKLLSKISSHLNAPSNIFDMLTDVDFKFDDIKDEKNKKVNLTNETYGKYISSKNRRVRKEAYESLYKTYGNFSNTLTEIYTNFIKKHSTMTRVRKHKSSLLRGLKSDNVKQEVVDNLIKEVNQNLSSLKDYLKIKSSFLKIKDLKMYDLYAPIVSFDKNYSFSEATKLMLDSLTPLGNEYKGIIKKGIEDRWIDIYENKGKASGAYSYGCYDSYPYVLLNFTSRIRDVFTLTHELGHSLHSYYTRKTQKYIYGGHSIFTAEVASTVNECLLSDYLISNAKNKNEKIYYLSQALEGFRTTLIRQVMFTEFEKTVFEIADKDIPLFKEDLISRYKKLNEKYFGKGAKVDDNIAIEFLRIPHFYRPFYVYKYATGYALSLYIADNLIKGFNINDFSFRDKYIKFLKSGDSNDPIELLKILGVDMGKPFVIKEAFKVFNNKIKQLKGLL